MIQVSDAYKELVKSNIRPKCEPIIKVSGIDNTGKEIELVWRAKNIKDLTYKRSIDPVGRELPYMELTWKEIYTGKLNAESYPEKYNNIAKYMEVELSFVQDLGFYNTWKMIFNGGITWKDLFSKSTTWKQIKNGVAQETIKMPKLFLTAKPSIEGQTITWMAKDLLSFAIEEQVYEFNGEKNSPALKNCVSFFTLNARSPFVKSLGLFTAFTDTVTELLKQDSINEHIEKRIICDGTTNNIILNLSSIYNYFLDFQSNIFVMKKFNPSTISSYSYKKNVLYSYPKIEKGIDISSYNFKYRIAENDINRASFKSPAWDKLYGDGIRRLHYELDGYGDAYYSNDEVSLESGINHGNIKTADIVGGESPTKEAYVIPLRYNSYEGVINIDAVGEVYSEDNPISPYDATSDIKKARKDFLSSYFTQNSSSLTFEALPNISIETNDVIEIETNLYQSDNKQIIKKGLVVYMELTYSGNLKQKIIAHEVSV